MGIEEGAALSALLQSRTEGEEVIQYCIIVYYVIIIMIYVYIYIYIYVWMCICIYIYI